MLKTTETTISYLQESKKNWSDYSLVNREIGVEKRLGDYLDDLLPATDTNVIIEIVSDSNKELSKIFSLKEYENEEDNLTRKELFRKLVRIEEKIYQVATGEYLITYKENEKGVKVVDKKTPEIITKEMNIQLTIE